MVAASPQHPKNLPHARVRLIRMAGRVEDIVVRAVRAVVRRDAELARETQMLHAAVVQSEAEIDRACIELIETLHPRGAELRTLTFMLKTAYGLERISALAASICRRAPNLVDDGVPDACIEIESMGALVSEMLAGAIDAFIGRDAREAQRVIELDDLLDDRYEAMRERQLAHALSDLPDGLRRRSIHVLTIGKQLERMGDHAVRIAENSLSIDTSGNQSGHK